MKNLIIFVMVMMVLGSGYMFGSKLAPETGLSNLPALDNDVSSYLNGHESENGIYSGTEDLYNALNSLFADYDSVGSLFDDYINEPVYTDAQTLVDDSSNQAGLISKDEAKIIAQKYIEEPGAIAGEPVLQKMDGKSTYIVPVLLNGKNVGEIYIDATTGENVGGAGGVDDNKTDNLTENNSKQTGNEYSVVCNEDDKSDKKTDKTNGSGCH